MKSIKILLITLLALIVSATANDIIVSNADTVWSLDLVAAPSGMNDSSETPSQNLSWAYVSQADTVWSLALYNYSLDMLDSSNSTPQNLSEAYVSQADTVLTINLEKPDFLNTTTTTSTTTSTTTTTPSLPYDKLVVTRILPSSAYAGSNLTVSLFMDVNESNTPNGAGLTEYYPEGWSLLNTSSGGLNQSNKIEWLFWSQSTPLTDLVINYTLRIPENANGTFNFSGVCYVENTSIAITGNTSLTVQGCVLKGNTPPCEEVSLSEVVNSINLWSQGLFNLPDVVLLINAWATMSGK